MDVLISSTLAIYNFWKKQKKIAITDNDPQLSNKQKQADAINAQLIIVTDLIGEFSSSAIFRDLMID